MANDSTLTIPDDEFLPSAWSESPAAFEAEARFLLGLKLLELGRFSARRAAEFSGLTKQDFLVKASALGVPVVRMDDDQLATEFANPERLLIALAGESVAAHARGQQSPPCRGQSPCFRPRRNGNSKHATTDPTARYTGPHTRPPPTRTCSETNCSASKTTPPLGISNRADNHLCIQQAWLRVPSCGDTPRLFPEEDPCAWPARRSCPGRARLAGGSVRSYPVSLPPTDRYVERGTRSKSSASGVAGMTATATFPGQTRQIHLGNPRHQPSAIPPAASGVQPATNRYRTARPTMRFPPAPTIASTAQSSSWTAPPSMPQILPRVQHGRLGMKLGTWLPAIRHPSIRVSFVAYLTSRSKLSLWLLNSGAYMHWISAIPVG